MRNLTVRKGVLYLSREVANLECSGADKIRQATLLGIEHACTKRPPPYKPEAVPELDTSALEALIMNKECLTADAASDVQLAGHELSGTDQLSGPNKRALKGVMHQVLPMLKACVQTNTTTDTYYLYIQAITGATFNCNTKTVSTVGGGS